MKISESQNVGRDRHHTAHTFMEQSYLNILLHYVYKIIYCHKLFKIISQIASRMVNNGAQQWHIGMQVIPWLHGLLR